MHANKTASVSVQDGYIHVRGNVDGKRYQRSTQKKNTKRNFLWVQKNAYNVLSNIIVEEKKQTEDNLQKGENTVYTYGYRSLSANSGTRAKNTTKEYIAIFRSNILPYFGDFALEDIKPTDLKIWQSKLLETRSGTTVINIRNILNGILKDARADQKIKENPLELVKRPKKEKPKVQPFKMKQVEKIIDNADGWFKNYLIIAFFTGIRSGEMIALRWKDIKFKKDIIKIRKATRKNQTNAPKTETSIREVLMLPQVKKALLEQYALTGDQKTVFVNQYGNHYASTEKIVKYKWAPLLKKCKIKYRILYKTRHTFASIMIQNNEEIAWVSYMLGHANIQITLEKYARYIPSKKKKRAKFLKKTKF